MEQTKKGDFIEIEFTGYHNEEVFDSNIPEDLKKLNPEAKPEKTVIIIGQKMVVPGLDNALEEKEIGKQYDVHVLYKDGFGERKRELVKTIPLSVFIKQKINPYPGQTLLLDNSVARVITVSGARVITDFNNPLAGKDLDYKVKIIRKVTEPGEKASAFFKFFFRHVPKFEVSGEKVVIKGDKVLEGLVRTFGEKFKEFTGNALEFQEEKPPAKPENPEA